MFLKILNRVAVQVMHLACSKYGKFQITAQLLPRVPPFSTLKGYEFYYGFRLSYRINCY